MKRSVSKLIKSLKQRPKSGESSSARYGDETPGISPSIPVGSTPKAQSTTVIPEIVIDVDKSTPDAGSETPRSGLPMSSGGEDRTASQLTTAEDLHSTGLKIVYTPPDGVAPLVDIILIHGLNGNWRKTWLHPNNSVFWPRDLLANDLPGARVLSFGYNADVAKWFGPVGVGSLRSHAISLLSDVADARRDDQAVSRRTEC